MHTRASSQRGLGLGESLLAIALVSLSVVAAATRLLPGAGTEPTVQGQAEVVATYLRLARVEAVSRERACRLAIDPQGARLAVLDTMGTPEEIDDRLLHERRLRDGVTIDGADGAEFRTDGSARPTRVMLTDGTRRAWVMVDAAARIRVE